MYVVHWSQNIDDLGLFVFIQRFFVLIIQLESQQGKQNAAEFFDSLSNPEMENLRKQLEDLQLVLYNKDSEIQQLKDTVSQTSVLTPPPDSQNGIQEKKVRDRILVLLDEILIPNH